MADRQYQERFTGYEEEPASRVWQGVEAQLNQQQSYLRQHGYWLSGVLAMLLVGAIATASFTGLFTRGKTTGENRQGPLVLADSLLKSEPAPDDDNASLAELPNTAIASNPATGQPSSKSSEQQKARSKQGKTIERMVKRHGAGSPTKPKHRSELHPRPSLKANAENLLAQSAQATKAPKTSLALSDKQQAGLIAPTKKWQLRLQSGGFRLYQNRSITAGYHKDLLDQYKGSTSQPFGIQARLMADYRLSKHWFIAAGAGLELIQQQFAFQPLAPAKRDPEENFAHTIGRSPAPAPASDPVQATNRLTYLNLPLQARYQYALHHFTISLEAGLTISRLVKASGKLLDPATQEVRALTASDGPLRKWQTRLVASPAVRYSLSRQLGLSLAPKAALNLQNRYRDAFPVGDQPTRLGLQMGLSYTF